MFLVGLWSGCRILRKTIIDLKRISSFNHNMKSKLCIFDYISPQEYLNDYYQLNKKDSSKFSYSSWAREIGFKNKTILRLILQRKRRITASSQLLFNHYFKFELLEYEYFNTLVAHSNCQNKIAKKQLSNEIIKMQRKHSTHLNQKIDAQLIYDAYLPIVFTILNSTDNILTAEEIQKFCPLPEIQIQYILNCLTDEKLIHKGDSGYQRKFNSFQVQDSPHHPNLKKYYEYWITKSIEAIKMPYDQRRYRSLQLPLTQIEFDLITSKVNEFALSLLADVENSDLNNRKIYLYNTTLFPIDFK